MMELSPEIKSQINRCCCWGLIDDLLKLPLDKINDKKYLHENIKYMKSKIFEIECWKTEDQNQSKKTLHDFEERKNGIIKCIDYIKKFI